jgi:hypothetical protein
LDGFDEKHGKNEDYAKSRPLTAWVVGGAGPARPLSDFPGRIAVPGSK